jgi:menaquinol-cytochrome c reductase iron-sulfur subunit
MTAQHDDRRSALAKIVTAGLAAIGTGLAALVGLVAAPVARGTERRWRRAASIFDLPPDAPMTAVLAERSADGWYQSRREVVVYIDREGDGYRALSATCTHLGCRVRWEEASRQFLCPCHGGVYDRSGRVVSGPPPVPLARINVRVNPQTSDFEVEL